MGRTFSDVELECIHGIDVEEEPLRRRIDGSPSRLMANPTIDLSDFISTMDYYANSNDPEDDVFYYHADQR